MIRSEELDTIINGKKFNCFAHRKEGSSQKELLSAHLALTYEYYKKMEREKDLNIIIKNTIKSAFDVDDKTANIGYELFESAIYYHDIGKINPLFQKEKMNNDLKIESNEQKSTHSALSARLYIDNFYKIAIENRDIKLTVLIYIYAYIISRHHSNMSQMYIFYKELENAEEPAIYKNKLSNNQCENIALNGIKEFLKSEKVDEISIYILCKLLYSCLITADFYATYEFMSNNKIDLESNDKGELFKKYEESELYRNIREYQKIRSGVSGINVLRNDLFLETEEKLLNNIDGNIFYLEAPTGSGKTNMAINLARILYKNNQKIKSINYIFPFNTIIEQTKNTFVNYFGEFKDFVTINSISNMAKDSEECLDFERAYIKNAFRQYPIIITSHINLFESLFGEGKEINYSLYNYINSVVVLDEIQAYSNNKWRQMIKMFDKYAKLCNIKFIIMSATLPRIDRLLDATPNNIVSLVDDINKYYQNPLFKNRVLVNYSLLNTKVELEELSKIIVSNINKKILVEFIKKKTADEFYNVLKENNVDNVYILTGDDNSYYKKQIIKKVSELTNIVLVSTQTIEAGVDIDMDIGYKDISFLDNEEQFLGRINRSNKKKDCKAYFFNYDDASKIYKSDNRIGLGINKKEVREYLENKNFTGFYDMVINRVRTETEKYNSNNISNLLNYCKFMNFKSVDESMKLIKNDTVQIFINYNIKVGNDELNGKEIFNKYKLIVQNNNIEYAEKKVKLSEINKLMELFIYTVYENELNSIKAEKFGDMYFIEDGQQYIKNGRFDRSLFLKEGDSLFI